MPNDEVLVIDEGLRRGLRRDWREGLTRQSLEICHNMRPSDVGLVAQEPIPYSDAAFKESAPELVLDPDFRRGLDDTYHTFSFGGSDSLPQNIGIATKVLYFRAAASGTYSDVIINTSTLVSGDTYRVLVHIKSITGGSINIKFGAGSWEVFKAGTHTFTTTWTTGNLDNLRLEAGSSGNTSAEIDYVSVVSATDGSVVDNPGFTGNANGWELYGFAYDDNSVKVGASFYGAYLKRPTTMTNGSRYQLELHIRDMLIGSSGGYGYFLVSAGSKTFKYFPPFTFDVASGELIYKTSFTADTSNGTVMAYWVGNTGTNGYIDVSYLNLESLDSTVVDFPYPTLHRGSSKTLLLTETDVYEVERPSRLKTKQTIYNARNQSSTASLTAYGRYPWEMVEWGDTMFLLNDFNLIITNPKFDINKYYVEKTLLPKSIAKYFNRLVVGGIEHTPQTRPTLLFVPTDGSSEGWTLDAGITIDSAPEFTFSTSNGPISAKAYPDNWVATPGLEYNLNYTISDLTSGSVTPKCGDWAGTTRTANGNYTEVIKTSVDGGYLQFDTASGTNSFKMSLLNIQLRESFFDTQEWAEIFQTWIESSLEVEYTDESMKFGPNWIIWSSPAGGDYFQPFREFLAMFGIPKFDDFYKLKPFILDSIRNRDVGMLRMPWEGSVLYMSKLGNQLVVYGNNGISAVSYDPQNQIHQVSNLLNIGIKGQAAVGVTDFRHVFVDTTGYIWSLTPDMQLERLGYSEFTASMSDPVVSVNVRDQAFYITDGNKGYRLDQYGLSEETQMPSTLTYLDGELTGFMVNPGGSGKIIVRTSPFDMGIRAIKTIHTIHVGYNEIDNLKVKIWYRVDSGAQWAASTEQEVNKEGIVVPIISGTEFKIELNGDYSENAKINYVGVRYRVGDKRGLRGQI